MQLTLDGELLNGAVVHGLSAVSQRWSCKIKQELAKHARYKGNVDYGVCLFHGVCALQLYRQTGYIKAAYIFDFRKEIGKGHSCIDKNMNRTILK